MFESLIGKTFLVLASQLLLTYLATSFVILVGKKMYAKGSSIVKGIERPNGFIDLTIEKKVYIVIPLILLTIVFLISTIATFAAVTAGYIEGGMIFFVITSIVLGLIIGLLLMSVEESFGGTGLGRKVLGITVMIVFITALVGIYSGVDFGFMGKFLLVALIIMFVLNVIRLIFSLGSFRDRSISLTTVIVFSLYLIYNFNMLIKADELSNTWKDAIIEAFNIYLVIINIFLYLLDFLIS